jgi:hypothetical protein
VVVQALDICTQAQMVLLQVVQAVVQDSLLLVPKVVAQGILLQPQHQQLQFKDFLGEVHKHPQGKQQEEVAVQDKLDFQELFLTLVQQMVVMEELLASLVHQ